MGKEKKAPGVSKPLKKKRFLSNTEIVQEDGAEEARDKRFLGVWGHGTTTCIKTGALEE